jgi:hypothetical protein
MRTRAFWDIRPPIYSAGAARGMEIAADEPWNPLGAMDRMLDDAGIGGDTPDYDEAKQGFLIHDLANPDQRVGYELPIADVFPCGRKKVHPAALEQAERDLRNHRAPDDIRAAALAVIDHYNQRIRRAAQAALKICGSKRSKRPTMPRLFRIRRNVPLEATHAGKSSPSSTS